MSNMDNGYSAMQKDEKERVLYESIAFLVAEMKTISIRLDEIKGGILSFRIDRANESKKVK